MSDRDVKPEKPENMRPTDLRRRGWGRDGWSGYLRWVCDPEVCGTPRGNEKAESEEAAP